VVRSRGVPYPVFRAVLDRGDLTRVRALAAEMGHVGLGDALRICVLLRDHDPERYEPAAVRWLGRFALEAPGATLEDLQAAAAALDALPTRPDAAMDVLSDVCVRNDLGERGGGG
jgi:hypothetical protein